MFNAILFPGHPQDGLQVRHEAHEARKGKGCIKRCSRCVSLFVFAAMHVYIVSCMLVHIVVIDIVKVLCYAHTCMSFIDNVN